MALSRGPVFISFASEDVAVADRFVASLEGAGIPCWIAHRDIPPGTSYPAVITSAIESAGALLVLITDAANASPHVLREVELAFGAGKAILPVRLSTVTLSQGLNYFLSTKQWLDAGTAFDDGDIERVRAALERLLAGGTGETAGTVAPWWGRRVALVGVAVVAAIIIAGAAALMYGRREPGVSNPVASATGVPAAGGSTSVAANAETPADAAGNATNPPDAGPASGRNVGAAAATPRAGRTRVNPIDGQTYVWIPPGEFVMGCSPGDPACSPDELPAHPVTVRGFWLAQTELTGAQYRKGAPAGKGVAATPDSPVTSITWVEAKAYCAAVGGRLPTEAEWEYAARASTTTFAYGRASAIGWHLENSDEMVHPVAKLKPNAWGLYDMLGNVHEWVLDRYFNKYDPDDEEIVEPTAPNALATIRGGAWTTEPGNLRASMRLERYPDTADPNIGVRCAQSGEAK